MGPRARLLALLIIFFMMSLAMGAFCNAISGLFVDFNPDAIIPSFGLMLVAVVMGVSIYKLKSPLGITTVVALALFAGLIFWGVEQPICTYEWFVQPETRAALDEARLSEPTADVPAFKLPYGAVAAITHFDAAGNQAAARDIESVLSTTKLSWIGVLLLYGFLASVLPVWLLLQPRDYINSFQLYFALTTMLVGMIIAGMIGAPENHIEGPSAPHKCSRGPRYFPVPVRYDRLRRGQRVSFARLERDDRETTEPRDRRPADRLWRDVGRGGPGDFGDSGVRGRAGGHILGRRRNVFHMVGHRAARGWPCSSAPWSMAARISSPNWESPTPTAARFWP